MGDLIKNREKAKQLIDFAGIFPPPLALTDIDAIFEWKDKGYVIIEVKHGDKEVPKGQQLVLERLAKDLTKAGKKVISVVAKHNIDDPEQTIYLKDCVVREMYYGIYEQWTLPKSNYTLDVFLQCFKEWLDS